MLGLFLKGTFSNLGTSKGRDHIMKCGIRHRVVRMFIDFDGSVHAVGKEWQIRLSNRPEDQGSICSNPKSHIRPVQKEVYYP